MNAVISDCKRLVPLRVAIMGMESDEATVGAVLKFIGRLYQDCEFIGHVEAHDKMQASMEVTLLCCYAMQCHAMLFYVVLRYAMFSMLSRLFKRMRKSAPEPSRLATHLLRKGSGRPRATSTPLYEFSLSPIELQRWPSSERTSIERRQ